MQYNAIVAALGILQTQYYSPTTCGYYTITGPFQTKYCMILQKNPQKPQTQKTPTQT